MRMLKNRKGVSEVVANVLIVLLVIVGIAVIWSVVKPTIDKSASQVQSDCFTVSVEPVSCTLSTTAGPATVVIKRNPGAGSFEAVDVIFSDGTNTGRVTVTPALSSTGTTPFTELSTRTLTGLAIPSPVTGSAKTANVVLTSGGNLCQITTQPVTCSPVPPA